MVQAILNSFFGAAATGAMLERPMASAAANDTRRFMILNPRGCCELKDWQSLSMPTLAIEASRVFIPTCTRKGRSRAVHLGPDAHASRNPSHHTLRYFKQSACQWKSRGLQPW